MASILNIVDILINLKHGDIFWVNLEPYVNLYCLCKFVDYYRFYNLKGTGVVLPFSFVILVNNKFYKKQIDDKPHFTPDCLLIEPYNMLFDNQTSENMTIIRRETVIQEEAFFFDLRIVPWDDDDEDLTDFNHCKTKDFSFEVRSINEDYEYESIGGFGFDQCAHLPFKTTIGSPYYVRSRIYLEYLKIHKPIMLKKELFGKLPEYLDYPDGVGSDIFIYNRYFCNPIYQNIPNELKFSAIE